MPKLLSTSLRATLALTALTGLTAATQAASASSQGKAHQASSKRASPAADLVLRGLEVDLGDETLGVTGQVTNIGSRRAPRTDVVIAVSDDPTLSEDDDVIDEVSVGRTQSGRSRDLDTEADIPADDDLPEGTVYLVVCVDGNDDVRERSETNNCDAEVIADPVDESTGSDDPADSSDDEDDGPGDPSGASQDA